MAVNFSVISFGGALANTFALRFKNSRFCIKAASPTKITIRHSLTEDTVLILSPDEISNCPLLIYSKALNNPSLATSNLVHLVDFIIYLYRLAGSNNIRR